MAYNDEIQPEKSKREDIAAYFRKRRADNSGRRFLVWDGEGYTSDDGAHHYCLFGNSDGAHVASHDLRTRECFEILINEAERNGKTVWNVSFAFDYDVNMILGSLERRHLHILRKFNRVNWQEYNIQYVPHKWFQLKNRITGTFILIDDAWSFFQASFIKACENYGVELSDRILTGKADRSNFSMIELDTEILPYWKEENAKAVELMDSLKGSLDSANLKIKRWYGPGVIANHTMKMHGIEECMGVRPEAVKTAAQHAYAGGRFECFKVGHFTQPVYEYDINSAYPYAIAQLPDFSNGEWHYVEYPESIERFGVYAVITRWQGGTYGPNPFVVRNRHGSVSYPRWAFTWSWGPELLVAQRHIDDWQAHDWPDNYSNIRDKLDRPPRMKVICGYVFREYSEKRPFSWVPDAYRLRQQYKRDGNGAEKAIKLQLNSMYGKMAQRVGWNEQKRTPPKWHNLEWAGWITSHCRSQILEAAFSAGDDLVSIETDAVFTTRALPELEIGEDLGQWEYIKFDEFVSLQSGCRFARKNGEWISAFRGFDPNSLNVDDAINAVQSQRAISGKNRVAQDRWTLTGDTTRFIGLGWALKNDLDKWRRWETKTRELQIGADGKRRHIPLFCDACIGSPHAMSADIHQCIDTSSRKTLATHPHTLPWKNGLSDVQEAIDEFKWEIEI